MSLDIRKMLIVGQRLQRMVTQLQHVPYTSVYTTYQQTIANPLLKFDALLSQIESEPPTNNAQHTTSVATPSDTTVTETLLRRRSLERKQFESPTRTYNSLDLEHDDHPANFLHLVEHNQDKPGTVPHPEQPSLPEAYLTERPLPPTAGMRKRRHDPSALSEQINVDSQRRVAKHNVHLDRLENLPASDTGGQAIPKAEQRGQNQTGDSAMPNNPPMTRLTRGLGDAASLVQPSLTAVPPASQMAHDSITNPFTTPPANLQHNGRANKPQELDTTQFHAMAMTQHKGFRLLRGADQLAEILRVNDIQSVETDTDSSTEIGFTRTRFGSQESNLSASIDFSDLPFEVVDAILNRLIEQLELDMLRTYGTSGVS